MGVRSDLITKIMARLRGAGADFTPDDLAGALDDAIAVYAEARPRVQDVTVNLAPGVTSYPLPEDWVAPEPAAWAALTDPVAEPINLYDHRGYGQVRTRPAMPLPTQQRTYQIRPGYPCTLVISWAPTAAEALPLTYLGSHTVGDQAGETTVPKPDWPLLVLRGVFEAWRMWSRDRAGRPIQFDAAADGHAQRVRVAEPDKLAEMAERDDAEFQRRLRRPLGVRG